MSIEENLGVTPDQQEIVKRQVTKLAITSRWAREFITKILNYSTLTCTMKGNVFYHVPTTLPEPVKEYLRSEMKRIPENKIGEVMDIIRSVQCSHILLGVLSLSGAIQEENKIVDKRSAAADCISHLQLKRISPHVVNGLQCLMEADDWLFVAAYGKEHSMVPQFFSRERAQKAHEYFRMASMEDITILEKYGFIWRDIWHFLCLYEGNINECVSPDEQMEEQYILPPGTPLAADIYSYSNLARESAPVFDVPDENLESVGIALATAESLLFDPDSIKRCRDFLDNTSLLAVFTDAEDLNTADEEMAKCARENADADEAFYEYKKQLEELALHLFQKLDSVTLPEFSAPCEDFLASDDAKKDM